MRRLDKRKLNDILTKVNEHVSLHPYLYCPYIGNLSKKEKKYLNKKGVVAFLHGFTNYYLMTTKEMKKEISLKHSNMDYSQLSYIIEKLNQSGICNHNGVLEDIEISYLMKQVHIPISVFVNQKENYSFIISVN